MNPQSFDLNRIKIASPCSVSWDNMTGDERSRHCSLCSLNVYNVSQLTADEVAGLIRGSDKRVCMRLYRRADGTIITKDCPVGIRAARRRVSIIAGAVFASVLGLFSASYSQTETKAAGGESGVKIIRVANSKSRLIGNVTNASSLVIPNAEIRIIRNTDKNTVTTTTGSDGHFEIPLQAGEYTIEIRILGYISNTIKKLAVDANEAVNLSIVAQLVTVTAGVAVELPSNRRGVNILKLEPTTPAKSSKKKKG